MDLESSKDNEVIKDVEFAKKSPGFSVSGNSRTRVRG